MGNLLVLLRRQETGFSYLMMMIAITLMGLAMTMAARQWKTMVQRELEADLLAKGIEIQTALALYSASAKAGRVMPGEVYPQTLAELTRPPKPFLRKVYLDPMERGEWELLRAPTGGIMGVRSKSKHKPLKQANFPLAVRHFEGKPTHYDWVFQHPNPSMASVAVPITNPLIVPRRSTISEQPLVSDELDSPESMDPQKTTVDSTDSPSIENIHPSD
ncbi:MAG: putative secretion system X pseudopilin PulG-like [Nitrospira sp.]|nr:MAG: putative secretion system X pseudopilin PulG-like [Nitrospira sp.]